MKITISIDEALLQEADETARSMGVGRSQRFGLAVTDFLKKRRMEAMLLRLHIVYADSAEEPLVKKIKTKMRQTVKDQW